MSIDTPKLCDEPVHNTATPPFQPTWEKFYASMCDHAGRVMPDQNNPRWKSYFHCWGIGYIAALRAVLQFTSPKK